MNKPTIPVVNECNHLGNVISNKKLLNNSIKIITDLNFKTHVILSEFYMNENLSRSRPFNSECKNIQGCDLINTNNKKWKLITYVVIGKKVVDVS